MKKNILLLLAFIFTLYINGQSIKEVGAKIAVQDTVKVNIVSVLPDSFPTITLTFKAQSLNGYPLWDLKAGQLAVYENNDSCEVIDFRSLTQEQGIKMAMVIDHSGSMMSDQGAIYTELDFYYYKEQIMEQSPLTKAKRAIKQFVGNLNFEKDAVSVIGFSSLVDVSTGLLHNKEDIMKYVNQLEIDGGTAFYDATFEAIQNLEKLLL
jgi:hypothetical protein